MAEGRRPRPRARKVSVDIVQGSSIDAVGSASTTSAASPPSSVHQPARIDSGEDDDFFVRRKKTSHRPVKAYAEKLFVLPEGEEDSSSEPEYDIGYSSDGEERRRKKIRRVMPSWTRTTSLPQNQAPSIRASSSQERESLVKSKTDFHGREEIQVDARRRQSRSPSLTPPPPLEKEVLDRIHSVIEQYAPSSLEVAEEEELYQLDDRPTSYLDPDLIRLAKGDRARELRRKAREQEESERKEAERNQRLHRPQLQAKASTNIIEVVDSDEDISVTSITRDSSPVEIVSFSSQTVWRCPEPAPVTSAAQQEMPHGEEDREDEVERIGITMKGGAGGTLQALVKVKRTTKMSKLLDHYKEQHKEVIPKAKLKFVHVRFDGESIDPNQTVGDVGIEDEEQVDVIW